MIVRRIMPSETGWRGNLDELENMRRKIRRLLGEVESGHGTSPNPGVFPAVNVTEDEENLYVRAELPGMKASDLKVEAVKNTLTISGRREVRPEQEKVSYHRREREGGQFSRRIVLPTDFEGDKVDARYTNGMLTITLPRAAETKPKQISINTA